MLLPSSLAALCLSSLPAARTSSTYAQKNAVMIVCFAAIIALLISTGSHVRLHPNLGHLQDSAKTTLRDADNAIAGQCQVMAGTLSSSNNAQIVDPKAPLSSEDLVKLLMQYSNDRVRENARDCSEKLERSVDHERNFTDEKLKTLAFHVNKRFNSVDNDIIKQNTAHAEQSRDVEKQLEMRLDSVEGSTNASIAAQSEIIAGLNLDIKTNSMYQEQLLFNLKSGLQDALHQIALDIKAVWAELLTSPTHQNPQSLNPTFRTNPHSDQHVSPANYVTNHSMGSTEFGLHVRQAHDLPNYSSVIS